MKLRGKTRAPRYRDPRLLVFEPGYCAWRTVIVCVAVDLQVNDCPLAVFAVRIATVTPQMFAAALTGTLAETLLWFRTFVISTLMRPVCCAQAAGEATPTIMSAEANVAAK